MSGERGIPQDEEKDREIQQRGSPPAAARQLSSPGGDGKPEEEEGRYHGALFIEEPQDK